MGLFEFVNIYYLTSVSFHSAVDQDLAFKAVEIYQQYGKGGNHPAQLNYGDCFAVALSLRYKIPVLHGEQQFSKMQVPELI